MHDMHWRAEEALEEEVISPFSKAADKADMRLEQKRLRRVRTRAELALGRYISQ